LAERVATALAALLAQSTVEEDESILVAGCGGSTELDVAVRFRLARKRLLQRTLDGLQLSLAWI
jgi:hypothetical protein